MVVPGNGPAGSGFQGVDRLKGRGERGTWGGRRAVEGRELLVASAGDVWQACKRNELVGTAPGGHCRAKCCA